MRGRYCKSKWIIIKVGQGACPCDSCNQPNSSYNQLWLQNMTYTQDKKQGTSPYTLRLCQLVAGKAVEPLWNNDWLKTELLTNIPYDSVVDEDALKKVTPVITFRETRRYEEIY